MKKNEIRFISQNGINCEGNVTLSPADRKKAEEMFDRVQAAAKDCGATLSLTPVGIQLGFEVALSCDTKCINEADARMKCIIEEMREFISNLEPAKHENKPRTEFDIAIEAAFETLKKHLPNSGFCIIGINPEDERAAMVGNINRKGAALMLLKSEIDHGDD